MDGKRPQDKKGGKRSKAAKEKKENRGDGLNAERKQSAGAVSQRQPADGMARFDRGSRPGAGQPDEEMVNAFKLTIEIQMDITGLPEIPRSRADAMMRQLQGEVADFSSQLQNEVSGAMVNLGSLLGPGGGPPAPVLQLQTSLNYDLPPILPTRMGLPVSPQGITNPNGGVAGGTVVNQSGVATGQELSTQGDRKRSLPGSKKKSSSITKNPQPQPAHSTTGEITTSGEGTTKTVSKKSTDDEKSDSGEPLSKANKTTSAAKKKGRGSKNTRNKNNRKTKR